MPESTRFWSSAFFTIRFSVCAMQIWCRSFSSLTHATILGAPSVTIHVTLLVIPHFSHFLCMKICLKRLLYISYSPGWMLGITTQASWHAVLGSGSPTVSTNMEVVHYVLRTDFIILLKASGRSADHASNFWGSQMKFKVKAKRGNRKQRKYCNTLWQYF